MFQKVSADFLQVNPVIPLYLVMLNYNKVDEGNQNPSPHVPLFIENQFSYTETIASTVEGDDIEGTADGNIRKEEEDQNEEEEEKEEEEVSADSEEGEDDEVVDGAVGGQDSPSGTFATHFANNQQQPRGFENQREDLLRDLQKEIEKLKLLGATGQFSYSLQVSLHTKSFCQKVLTYEKFCFIYYHEGKIYKAGANILFKTRQQVFTYSCPYVFIIYFYCLYLCSWALPKSRDDFYWFKDLCPPHEIKARSCWRAT